MQIQIRGNPKVFAYVCCDIFFGPWRWPASFIQSMNIHWGPTCSRLVPGCRCTEDRGSSSLSVDLASYRCRQLASKVIREWYGWWRKQNRVWVRRHSFRLESLSGERETNNNNRTTPPEQHSRQRERSVPRSKLAVSSTCSRNKRRPGSADQLLRYQLPEVSHVIKFPRTVC